MSTIDKFMLIVIGILTASLMVTQAEVQKLKKQVFSLRMKTSDYDEGDPL